VPAPRVLPLPEPDADARAHSGRVLAAVREAIGAAGGFLTLERYLALVLYAPGLGYYVAGTRKFGAGGDFVTAPELTPLFGGALAVQVEAILAATRGRRIVEIGAGSGALAADVLDALAARDALPARYEIVEVSPELRERQRDTLAARAGAHASLVTWHTALPDSIEGAVLLNEVLDAVPPHVIVRRGPTWLERGVAPGAQGLELAERPLEDARLRALAQRRFPASGDYMSEINPASEALIEDLGARLREGAMLIIDYGFPAAEYYHPQRSAGTLMGHYRHRVHADPLLWPGLSDLTAHVDFSAIAEAGERSGLHVAGFTSQAAFLLGCGILDLVARAGAPDGAAYLRAAAAVQQLTSPAEMGELFKVLALARSEGIEWPGYAIADRSHRLGSE
jgi:SAM-dependent MidA family methyltransferase